MRQKATRVVGMYPKLGAAIVWLAVAVMLAASFSGCVSIPTKVVVHVEVYK